MTRITDRRHEADFELCRERLTEALADLEIADAIIRRSIDFLGDGRPEEALNQLQAWRLVY